MVDWKPRRKNLRENNSVSVEQHLRDALAWLIDHQNPAGYWDCDGFAAECERLGKERCDGPGAAEHDVGVTGLALLALAGADFAAETGGFREPMGSAVRWLLDAQDPETGRIGLATHHDFIYDHLVATYALCDALYTIEDPDDRARVQRAIDYIVAARNPYGAWRYDVPPIGDNDTSVTAWALAVLAVARKRERLRVPDEALEGGMAWIDEVTYRESGRVGYDAPRTLSARTPANDRFPRDLAEALTGAGLWCRYLLGEGARDPALTKQQVALLLEHPPVWDESTLGIDMYAWYYGTYALFQAGGKPWKTWNSALKKALASSQHDRGRSKGSWDPVGPWGYVGGRVYSTALLALTLEVYWRYPRFAE